MLEEELLSLDGLSAKIAHAIRTRTVAAAAGANAHAPRAWASPARPRPYRSPSASVTAPSPGSRGLDAIQQITRQVRACTSALSPTGPSGASPPRASASPHGTAHSPSSPSPVARALQLPAQCDTLPDFPQLRRVLDEMGIREVEQKHMQQQAELMLSSHNV